MAKFAKVCVLVAVVFGIFALCQADVVDDILRDPAAVERHIRCVLDQGPCDNFGKAAKGGLKEAIVNQCAKCTPVQRNNVNKISAYVRSRYPREWDAIVAKSYQ